MKKVIKIISIAIVLVIILVVSNHIIQRYAYAEEFQNYPVNTKKDSIVTVGIIGDSWVANKNIDDYLHIALLNKGIENKIISSGNSSAKSKLIYENMFKDSTDKHSSKFVIKQKPDYCIVIAGVNDAIGQIGANFYSHHIHLILNTLLHHNIKPVILELPEFGIVEAVNNLNTLNKIKIKTFSLFSTNGNLDNIKSYRENLKQLLATHNLNKNVIVISFDDLCTDYNTCKHIYKSDGIHLNDYGKKLLSETFANKLAPIITSH